MLTEVDDLVYTGTQDMIDEFEAKLKKKWKITDCERLSSFLGINIKYDLARGILEFDVSNKITKIFEDKP